MSGTSDQPNLTELGMRQWLDLDASWDLFRQESDPFHDDYGEETNFNSSEFFPSPAADSRTAARAFAHEWINDLYDSGALSGPGSQDCSVSSSRHSAQRSRHVSFVSASATESTAGSPTDTGSTASFGSYSPIAVRDIVPSALHDLTANAILNRSLPQMHAATLVPQPAVLPQRKPKRHLLTCTICKRTFGRPSDLDRHMNDIHEHGAVYRCTECKHAKFGRKDKVQEHYRRCHGAQIPTIPKADDPEAAAALHATRKRKKGRSR